MGIKGDTKWTPKQTQWVVISKLLLESRDICNKMTVLTTEFRSLVESHTASDEHGLKVVQDKNNLATT